MNYTTKAFKEMNNKELKAFSKMAVKAVKPAIQQDNALNKLFNEDPEFLGEFLVLVLRRFSEYEFVRPFHKELDKVNIPRFFEIFLPNFFTDDEIKSYIDFQLSFFLNTFGVMGNQLLLNILFGSEKEEDAPRLWKLVDEVFSDRAPSITFEI